MKNKDQICAIVVTYNRKKLLINCLDSLLKQTRPLEAIHLIDNASSDGTAELLREYNYIGELPPDKLSKPYESVIEYNNRRYIDTLNDGNEPGKILIESKIYIYYVRMNKNTGGAGGFYEGQKRACEKGFDWLWLMDDDGAPSVNALELLTEQTNISTNLAAVSCLVISNTDESKLAFKLPILDENGKAKSYNGKRYFYLKQDFFEYCQNNTYPWANFFNGVMINVKAIQKIGYIKKELFIWGDEQDYMFRLMKWGEVLTVANAFHFHPDNNKENPPLWKKTYGFRNELYLHRKYRNFKALRILKSILLNFNYFRKNKGIKNYYLAIIDSFRL